RAQDLRDRFRPPRAGLYGRIVGDDHGGAAFDFSDASDDARARRLAVILIPGDQQTDLEKPGARVEQSRDALARGQFTGAVLLFNSCGSAACAKPALEVVQGIDQM